MASGLSQTRAGRASGGVASRWFLLVGGLATSLSAGCVSIRMEEPIASPGVYNSGFLEVRVFETMSALKKDTPTERQILCELYARAGEAGAALVHGSSEPVWALSDLPPGKYRLKAVGLVDREGRVSTFWPSDWKEFEVGPGMGVRLSVVLSSGEGLARNAAYGVAWVGFGVLCAYVNERGVPCSWP